MRAAAAAGKAQAGVKGRGAARRPVSAVTDSTSPMGERAAGEGRTVCLETDSMASETAEEGLLALPAVSMIKTTSRGRILELELRLGV